MTRRFIYGIGLWTALAATAMTIASIVMPRWLSYSPDGTKIQFSYGLHYRCSAVKGTCTPFPEQYEDCVGDKLSFCSMWRTVGFLMSLSVITELASLVAYIVVLLGGKQKRDKGWKMVSGILIVSGLIQCISMAIVAFLFDNDDRFFEGWRLDTSWVLCTVSWSVQVTSAAGIIAAAIYMPEEGGYELIPNIN